MTEFLTLLYTPIKNPRAMKLCAVVVEIMYNLLLFKLEFKKVFLAHSEIERGS